MPTRFRKVRRQRGSRFHGWGQVGQHRKSGGRGGRGKAGLHKHKWSWVVKYAPDHFGTDSFKPPHQVKMEKWVNVGQLDALHENLPDEKDRKKKEAVVNLVEMGYSKLLGAGAVRGAYTVVAKSFTEAAKAKIEKAGGKIVTG